MTQHTVFRRGLVLGKFLPPHAGHLHLIRVARALCEELIVVVGTLRREPIAGELRYAWMRELCTDCEVLHLDEELPQDPSETEEFWPLWRSALERVLGGRGIDRVFASESYGHRLALELGATFVPVDTGRVGLPISGTCVRNDPWASPDLLPPPVRAHCTRRVSVVGPESCGKSTLTAELAHSLGTVSVPEYARTLLEAFPEWGAEGTLPPSVFPEIARGQIATEDSLARVATRVLLCDTDPLMTVLWAEEFGAPLPSHLRERALSRRYAHTLLLAPDLPYEEDAVRFRPDSRASFFERCVAILEEAKRPYSVVRGVGAARFACARAALEEGLRRSE